MERSDQRPSLEDQIAEKFKRVTTDALISRMERAADFGYDDESFELNRRLKLEGKTWRWDGDRVVVYDLEPTDAELAGLTGDALLIQNAVDRWLEGDRSEPIDDTAARVIASQWHSGASSAFYSFASTGRIDKDGLTREVVMHLIDTDASDEDDNAQLEALTHYFIQHGERAAVEGWHESTRWGGE